MKTRISMRLLALLLAVLTAFGAFGLTSFATDGSQGGDGGFSRDIEEIRTLLDTITYKAYLEKYADIAGGTDSVVISAAKDYVTGAETDAEVKVMQNVGGKTGDVLHVDDEGKVTFKVTIPKTGMYSISTMYYPTGDRATSIERMLYIDGKVPFSEARYLTMTKVWTDVYPGEFGVYEKDAQGNDIRPNKEQIPEWRNYDFCDSTGYYVNPFTFYLTEGEHTLTLESVREPVILDTITIKPVITYPSYNDYLASFSGAADVQNGIVHIYAENPTATSEQILYPIYDRTSAITEPQHPSQIRLNTFGDTKWQTVGQWVRYDNITVEESGFYQISMRYKQDTLSGMFASRRIRINGEIPFDEASYLQFKYSNEWQCEVLNDGTTDFKFYFEKGKTYSITFEVVLGHMANTLREVSEILTSLNDDYLQILMITGASPDEYRDYGFFKLMPDVIMDLRDCAKRMQQIATDFYEATGSKGSSVATLEKIANLITRMASKEDQVAKNLETFKTYLGTLGTWLYSSQQQALEIDFVQIQGVADETPRGEAAWYSSAWYEIRQFFASFVADYNSMGGDVDESDASATTVEIWYSGGRDRAQILRQLIDNEFTPMTKATYGHTINVELKLVAGGLLQSVLAGIGPDVAFLGSSDTINWALRGALNPLDGYEDFDKITSGDDAWFAEAAMIPLRLNLGNGEKPLTYGLPNTMDFSMLFYRMDVLVELDEDVPKTWQDLYDLLPKLQTNNMEVAFPSQLGGLQLLTYQMGGSMYANNDTDGTSINFNDNTTLSAWETMMDLFEQYRFPLSYNFATRFRTGEMPIGVLSYTSYNQLVLYASELRGLWEFVPLPGFMDENGKINNVSTVAVDAIVMPTGVEESIKPDAWRLMTWYCSAPTQARYANELQAILGTGGKYNTANIQAISELPWTATEYKALEAQMNSLAGVPEFPGSYIIARYVQFAFMNIYNDSEEATGESAVDSLLSYMVDINKELNRKRKEFDLDYVEY